MAAIFHKDSRVEPISFWLGDTEYEIDRITEEVRGETFKRSGAGKRYKIRVIDEGVIRESYLFRIGGLWYLAEQGDGSPDIQTRHIGLNFSGERIIDNRYENPRKVAVDVVAICDKNGNTDPYAFWWEDGRKYQIDRILKREQAASLKAGIIGMRYTIRVLGKETYLFRDDDLWFMERKGHYHVLDVHGRTLTE